MKRSHEQVESESESPPVEESIPETNILQDFQTSLLKGDMSTHIEKRLFETQKQYFTVYMQKLMSHIPMGKDLVNVIEERSGVNEFEYMFTAAKCVITSQMQVKQIKAYHAIFDMVYGLGLRYVHEKIVSPTLSKVVPVQQLNVAYDKYQRCSKSEEDGSVTELQCLLYCIESMLANQESAKIPNPLYTRLTHHMKAVSEYVIALLVGMAKPAGGRENEASDEFEIMREK